MAKPINPLQIRERIQHYGNQPTPVEFPTRKQGESDDDYKKRFQKIRGALIGDIEKELESFGDGDLSEARRLVFGYLILPGEMNFSGIHTFDISPQFWNALSRWRAVYDPERWEYIKRETFGVEVKQVFRFAAWALKVQRANPIYLFSDILEGQEHITIETESEEVYKTLKKTSA